MIVRLTQAQILKAIGPCKGEKAFVTLAHEGAEITIQHQRLARALRATAKHPNREIHLEIGSPLTARFRIFWGEPTSDGRLRMGALEFADQRNRMGAGLARCHAFDREQPSKAA